MVQHFGFSSFGVYGTGVHGCTDRSSFKHVEKPFSPFALEFRGLGFSFKVWGSGFGASCFMILEVTVEQNNNSRPAYIWHLFKDLSAR